MLKNHTINPRSRIYLSFSLLGISMIWQHGVWLVFVALLPLISYLPYINKSSTKSVIKDFYISGFILCGFANAFLFQVAPENWTIELDGWFGIVSRIMSWVFVCSFCAISYGLLGYIVTKIKFDSLKLLALPILFPLAEIFRSYLFAIMAYGPHGSFSPNYNWGSIAVPASGTPLVYSSRILGFFGLTFLVVLVNICLYTILIRRRFLMPLLILWGILALMLIGWSLGDNQPRSSLQATAVHMNEESDLTIATTAVWPPQGTDLLVLPEYSAVLKYKDFKHMLGRLSKDGIAVTTISVGNAPKASNRIIFLDRQGTIIFSQDKTFLIPTGEYVPYSLQIGFRAIGKSKALVDFKYSQQLEPGNIPEQVFTTKNGVTIGALACSGVSALNEYSRLTNDGAQVLTNSASLAFLQPNSLYHIYARNMARFQAVSNNQPFVQASRSGQSYIMDNQGKILIESHSQIDQVLSNSIYVQK